MDDLDVSARCCCEMFEVFCIHRHDLVPIVGEQYECRIDHIGKARSREQFSRGSAKRFVERPHIDPSKRLRQTSLARTSSPDLSENAGMRER